MPTRGSNRNVAYLECYRLGSLRRRHTGTTRANEGRSKLLEGPDEINLVRSGLEDTMCEAYGEIKEQFLNNEKIKDRRMAAYALAIRKIAAIYESMHL